MQKLNLAAESFRAHIIARRRRVVYSLSAALLALLVASWGVLSLLALRVESAIRDTQAASARLDAELNTRKEDVRAIALFARRLALMKERLNAHVGWSKPLGELEKVTTPPARFRKIQGSAESGTVTADVLGPNLDAAADLVASLQRSEPKNPTPFLSVEVVGITEATGLPEGEQGFALALRLTVPPELFRLGTDESSGL